MGRQIIERKEAGFDDLAIWQTRRNLAKGSDHIKQNMITWRREIIAVDRKKIRFARQQDIAFLGKLGLQRVARVLASLDPATRKMPARHVGMANQKNAAVAIKHHRPHPHGHPACQAEPEMKHPAEQTIRKARLRLPGIAA